MIIDFFILFAGLIIHIVAFLFSIITVIIPSQIETSLAWFFAQTSIFNGVFPMATVYEASAWLLVLASAYWIVRATIWALNLIPGIEIHMPLMRHKKGLAVNKTIK